jgi:hypothetical protein
MSGKAMRDSNNCDASRQVRLFLPLIFLTSLAACHSLRSATKNGGPPHMASAVAVRAINPTVVSEGLNYTPAAPTSVLKVEIIYRELFIYDACGLSEDGIRERLELRRLVMNCSMSRADKSEAIQFMDSPANQHYGDHDRTLCSDDPVIARMVRNGTSESRRIRRELVANAAHCMSELPSELVRTLGGSSSAYHDYWLGLGGTGMSGLKPEEGTK